MDSRKIKVGVVGGSGYTGGELVRLLLNHDNVELDFVFSTTRGGQPLHQTHADLIGETDIQFTDQVNGYVDVIFLCTGHGNSTQVLEENPISDSCKIIDLSRDFRHRKDSEWKGRKFVYGLPELNREAIQSSDSIANPGCFATAIQLALLPLAKAGKIDEAVHINAVTGSTGAGVKPSDTVHFSWRNNNVSWYKPFTHQHLQEIRESLSSFGNSVGETLFLPVRGNFARGIWATAYLKFEDSIEIAQEIYNSFYKDAAFTHLSQNPIHLKQVVNTNQCHIHLHQHDGKLLITSAIDNLLKGASGQAVQNMNLMFGFKENEGLKLKSGVF